MVNVNNEWGKLKEVIVGTVDNANMPTPQLNIFKQK